jgi:hypothetical protein
LRWYRGSPSKGCRSKKERPKNLSFLYVFETFWQMIKNRKFAQEHISDPEGLEGGVMNSFSTSVSTERPAIA